MQPEPQGPCDRQQGDEEATVVRPGAEGQQRAQRGDGPKTEGPDHVDPAGIPRSALDRRGKCHYRRHGRRGQQQRRAERERGHSRTSGCSNRPSHPWNSTLPVMATMQVQPSTGSTRGV